MYSSINNVKVNKTIISEMDSIHFKVGKDFFQLNSDELLNDRAFRKMYVKIKGRLLPEFTQFEWAGFVTEIYKIADWVEAEEVSEAVLTGKLFIDDIKTQPSTKDPEKAFNMLLDRDGFLYMRIGAVTEWLKKKNHKLGLAAFSKVLVELGFKTPGNKIITFLDNKTGLYWEFKVQ